MVYWGRLTHGQMGSEMISILKLVILALLAKFMKGSRCENNQWPGIESSDQIESDDDGFILLHICSGDSGGIGGKADKSDGIGGDHSSIRPFRWKAHDLHRDLDGYTTHMALRFVKTTVVSLEM